MPLIIRFSTNPASGSISEVVLTLELSITITIPGGLMMMAIMMMRISFWDWMAKLGWNTHSVIFRLIWASTGNPLLTLSEQMMSGSATWVSLYVTPGNKETQVSC